MIQDAVSDEARSGESSWDVVALLHLDSPAWPSIPLRQDSRFVIPGSPLRGAPE
jgi:hypothetical protein